MLFPSKEFLPMSFKYVITEPSRVKKEFSAIFLINWLFSNIMQYLNIEYWNKCRGFAFGLPHKYESICTISTTVTVHSKQLTTHMWVWECTLYRARICKRLRRPGIDSEDSIPPAYVAWRAGTKNRVVVPARQAGNRFLGSLKGIQIRAQYTRKRIGRSRRTLYSNKNAEYLFEKDLKNVSGRKLPI